MLNEREWNTINNILLELYTLDNLDALEMKVLKVMRMLIPYTKAYFIVFDAEEKIINNTIKYIGFENADMENYINNFYEQDYLQFLYDITTETTVYRDSSILNDEIRKNTSFYKKFLIPENIPFGCGILLIRKGKFKAIFNLFRNANLCDFSEKDLYILEILKKHLDNMIYRILTLSDKNENDKERFSEMQKKYDLTQREVEILDLLRKGLSNEEICKNLYVSISTVKKHVYNLFTKTNSTSRTQLINKLYSEK